MIGAVGHVAIAAIFSNRGVFKQKGAAFFRVAFVAGVVDVTVIEQRWPGASMWLVAIAAHLQSFTHRMCGGAHEVGALAAMAVQAKIALGFASEHRIAGGVNVVTVDTGKLFELVNTACPMVVDVAAVAIETDLIFQFGGFARGKNNGGFRSRSARAAPYVSGTGPVTLLALPGAFAERTVGMASLSVWGVEDFVDWIEAIRPMAGKAGLGAAGREGLLIVCCNG